MSVVIALHKVNGLMFAAVAEALMSRAAARRRQNRSVSRGRAGQEDAAWAAGVSSFAVGACELSEELARRC